MSRKQVKPTPLISALRRRRTKAARSPFLRRLQRAADYAAGWYGPRALWQLRRIPPGLRKARKVETPLQALRRGKLLPLDRQLNKRRALSVGSESFAGNLYINERAFAQWSKKRERVALSRLPYKRKKGK